MIWQPLQDSVPEGYSGPPLAATRSSRLRYPAIQKTPAHLSSSGTLVGDK